HSLLPEDKAQIIKKYESNNTRVLFAGDGINDAPALASASVGLTVAGGSDVAMEACAITLLKNDLNGIVNAVNLSSAVMKKIRQNLFWAFFYNCLGIPLAAFGFLSPLIAGSAMAFSSVSVVTNSLLLKKKKLF
ncbi:MAG TPA: HAD-IC family P-type ATPase, partial [Spirochaetota bacterium]|nr:HAD-IC family P-type ATPase [Spirochaetota bacterium]